MSIEKPEGFGNLIGGGSHLSQVFLQPVKAAGDLSTFETLRAQSKSQSVMLLTPDAHNRVEGELIIHMFYFEKL